jgi:RHS repeat-associated protein
MGCLKLSYYEQERALEVNPIFFTSAVEKKRYAEKNRLSSSTYGFNGQEKDNEVKGVGNSYNFGDRIQDPRLGGGFLSLDKFADKNPSFSPYIFADNNPIVFIDKDGNFRLSKRNQKKYPQLTNLLKNIQQTVHDDPKLFEAFRDNLGLTDEQANEILEWGKGPKVKMRNLGKIDITEEFGFTQNKKEININKHMVSALEGFVDNPVSKEAIVFSVFATILHEGQHLAEFLYGIDKFDPFDQSDPDKEAGFAFEIRAFGEIGFINPENAPPKILPFAATFDEMLINMGDKEVNFIPGENKGGKIPIEIIVTPKKISENLDVDTDVQK